VQHRNSGLTEQICPPRHAPSLLEVRARAPGYLRENWKMQRPGPTQLPGQISLPIPHDRQTNRMDLLLPDEDLGGGAAADPTPPKPEVSRGTPVLFCTLPVMLSNPTLTQNDSLFEEGRS